MFMAQTHAEKTCRRSLGEQTCHNWPPVQSLLLECALDQSNPLKSQVARQAIPQTNVFWSVWHHCHSFQISLTMPVEVQMADCLQPVPSPTVRPELSHCMTEHVHHQANVALGERSLKPLILCQGSSSQYNGLKDAAGTKAHGEDARQGQPPSVTRKSSWRKPNSLLWHRWCHNVLNNDTA